MGKEFSPCLDADSQQGPVPRIARIPGSGCGLFVQAVGLTAENKSASYSRGEAAPLPAERTARFTAPGHRLCWQPKGREKQWKGCCCFGPTLPKVSPKKPRPWQPSAGEPCVLQLQHGGFVPLSSSRQQEEHRSPPQTSLPNVQP